MMADCGIDGAFDFGIPTSLRLMKQRLLYDSAAELFCLLCNANAYEDHHYTILVMIH